MKQLRPRRKNWASRLKTIFMLLLPDLLVCRRFPSCCLGEAYSLLESVQDLLFVSPPPEWFSVEAMET